ncbi:hypothetical protein BPS26883_06134 [Burkholderia pseudomultivorans]|uniref:Uncharacterized protein n=1 Tax=Burkholderia pseudomultivorans TaxID=1207504 RepID=A0A6P2R2U8_9BURK|nr:hypothetical protein BPS26883_06134 [Burkholderia pseudomultivorans]
MDVLMVRRGPRWGRTVVAVIALMRLHNADRRKERESQAVRRAYCDPKQFRRRR